MFPDSWRLAVAWGYSSSGLHDASSVPKQLLLPVASVFSKLKLPPCILHLARSVGAKPNSLLQPSAGVRVVWSFKARTGTHRTSFTTFLLSLSTIKKSGTKPLLYTSSSSRWSQIHEISRKQKLSVSEPLIGGRCCCLLMNLISRIWPGDLPTTTPPGGLPHTRYPQQQIRAPGGHSHTNMNVLSCLNMNCIPKYT